MTADMFATEPRLEDKNRRYTTQSFMLQVNAWAGVTAWDLDPAADEESHHAPRWFSVQPYKGSAGVNGLAQSWLPPPPICENRGDMCGREDGIVCAENECDLINEFYRRPWRTFVNPPFSDLEPWLVKAWETLEASRAAHVDITMAMILPGDRHEQPFWQRHIEPFRFEISRAARFGYELTVRFPAGRVGYAKPGSNGVASDEAFFPSCVLIWKRQ